MGNEHIRFAPEMLRRLGEELVPHVDQGLVELVRNSYDADALVCKVELLGAERPGGTIRITDDGIGMDADTIRSGWLILGSSTKPSRRFTDLGRRPVGEKGLGRLAALRFGQEVSLKTRPKSESGWQYELIIDWALYDSVSAVEDVPLTIVRNPTESPQGTEIEIRGIQRGLNRRDILNLARSLLLLADPFAQTKGFRPILVAPDFEDLEKRVQNSYFDVASYHFVAELGSNGKAAAKVFDRNKRVIFEANHENIIDRPRRLASATYETVPAKFELWPFLLSSGNFSRECRQNNLV